MLIITCNRSVKIETHPFYHLIDLFYNVGSLHKFRYQEMENPETLLQCSEKKSFLIKLLILLILWVIIFIPVYPSLVDTWLNDTDNSHGILIPFISIFLIWQKRDELKSARISSSNWGAIILAASMFLYLLGFASGITVVSRCMIVFSLIGLLLFTLGKEVFRIFAFPLLFLLFMIPVPAAILGVISLPLQLFATKIAYLFIQALSIPVHQEGNMLFFAQTQLEVAEACSGIRSIAAFTVLSVVFAYLLDKGWSRRIVLLVSAIPLALFTNIIRITGTGILAHYYGSEFAGGFLHEFSGIAVFALGFVLLLFEFILLNRVGAKGG